MMISLLHCGQSFEEKKIFNMRGLRKILLSLNIGGEFSQFLLSALAAGDKCFLNLVKRNMVQKLCMKIKHRYLKLLKPQYRVKDAVSGLAMTKIVYPDPTNLPRSESHASLKQTLIYIFKRRSGHNLFLPP